MSARRHLLFLSILLAAALAAATAPSALRAQSGESCPALVEAALSAVDESCAAAGRNQACYGHVSAAAETFPAAAVRFDEPGDIADLTPIRRLSLSAMDEADGLWGVAVLRIQADLPDTLPGQNVTFLLFGDVDLRAEPPTPVLPATITASGSVNVRQTPSATGAVTVSLPPDSHLLVAGQDASGDWLRVRLPESGQLGWLSAGLVTFDAEDGNLPVVRPNEPVFGPIQAFYLQTGLGAPACVQAPPDGLLIQTPSGAGPVTLRVNETTVELGSTIFLQAQPGGNLVIRVVEGRARVTAFGVTRTVPAGARVVVPLDDDGAASGPPALPEPYDADALAALPVRSLPDPVTVAAPADPADLSTADSSAPAVERACTVTAGATVNLRGGPGTAYARAGTLSGSASPDGQAEGTDGFTWWHFPEDTWVRADVVQADGDCEQLPVVTDLPPVPTPAPASSGGGSSSPNLVYLGLNECIQSRPLYVGDSVQVAFGSGYCTTEAEAAAIGIAGPNSLSVNGQPLPIWTEPAPCIPENWNGDTGFHYHVNASWVAPAPGEYTFTGSSPYGQPTGACTYTVLPAPPTPTPVNTGGGSGGGTWHPSEAYIGMRADFGCNENAPVYPGMTVYIGFGTGTWPTEAEAAAASVGPNSLTVNGQPVPIYTETAACTSADCNFFGYTYHVNTVWIAPAPGLYTFVGTSPYGEHTVTCTLGVQAE